MKPPESISVFRALVGNTKRVLQCFVLHKLYQLCVTHEHNFSKYSIPGSLKFLSFFRQNFHLNPLRCRCKNSVETSRFYSMPKLENFLNYKAKRLTFLNKDQQFKEGSRECFRGNSSVISDCRVWSILKTLSGCRVSRHYVNFIVESKPLPVEVNNSPIELHLPAEAKEKRAIVESKPSPFEVNNSIIEVHLPVEAKENRAIIESKVKPSPVEVNNSTIEL